MKTKLDDLDRNQKNILTIVLSILVLVGFIIYSIITDKNDEYEYQKEEYKVSNVRDNSRYFTVINAVDKFLNTVLSGNSSDILLLLDDNYKKTYNITELNYTNFIPKLDANTPYSYEGNSMKQKRISKDIIVYYVTGNIMIDNIDDDVIYTSYNPTVIFYEKDLTFSIRLGEV